VWVVSADRSGGCAEGDPPIGAANEDYPLPPHPPYNPPFSLERFPAAMRCAEKRERRLARQSDNGEENSMRLTRVGVAGMGAPANL